MKLLLRRLIPFNPDSPKQLSAALFNKPTAEPPGLGLKPIKRGKTGPSTDQEVLERLGNSPEVDTPLPQLVLRYRQLTKLVGTYLVSLKEAISPATGRVHASFNQTGTSTGRLSSSDPNLQNISDSYRGGQRNSTSLQGTEGATFTDGRLLTN